MLYAFLLVSRSGELRLRSSCRKVSGPETGHVRRHAADCALELYQKLAPQIDDTRVSQDLRGNRPSVVPTCCARMEQTGIRIEPAQLGVLSERMDAEMQRLSREIHTIAGVPFNINSPQQLGKVLYEDLKLPSPVKYGKGKTIVHRGRHPGSARREHAIARLVLEYRQLSKLKGTYVDALPALIRRDTGRLHTTFNQAGAATGRLSSSNPNLQNIPIRTELGREIRAAFVPREGWELVVADYSQIELRLLAHMSGDPVLVDAFRNGEDIHTRTAAEVFGVSAADGHPRDAPQCQGRKLRHRLRADTFRLGGAAWNRSQGSRGLYSRATLSAIPG